MADAPRPRRKTRGRPDTLPPAVDIEVGVPTYHDYRQGTPDRGDVSRTRRGSAPDCPPECKGNFTGID